MRSFGLLILIAVGLAQAATITGPECLSDADCSATECCYKKHDDLVVSKRGNTFEGFPSHNHDLTHVKGVCQSYHNEGAYCSPFDKANGFCSCNEKAGQTCQYVQSQDTMSRYTCKSA